MKKALFFALVILLVFSGASLVSAGFFHNVATATKWVNNHVNEVNISYQGRYSNVNISYSRQPNYYVTSTYYRAPRNTYYVPPQPSYYGYSQYTGYSPRSYYYVYSGSGYTYSGPVVAYD
ncbi:MAG TPA: hypothetical protein VI977_00230 [archaeon]|nr:hypothetical protein [archaeon]